MPSCTPPAALNVLPWPIAAPKNRVGGSPAFSFVFMFQYIGETLDTPVENGGCGYDFASGVHKYLYAEDCPINNTDLSGNQIDGEIQVCDYFAGSESVQTPVSGQLAGEVAYAEFTYGPLGKKLLAHYMDMSGTPLTLSIDDMVEVGALDETALDPPHLQDSVGFSQFQQQLSGGGSVQINDMPLEMIATEWSTLGTFWAYFTGTLHGSPNDWSFKGTMRFQDNYHFTYRPDGRFSRNYRCFLMRNFVDGKNFNENSELAPVTQTVNDREIQWKGTGKRNYDGQGNEND
jgi:hypothetical protein